MRRSPVWLTTVLLLSLLAACSNTSRRATVEQPPSHQPTPQSTPIQLDIARAPKLGEMQEAVKRVFKDAAAIDPNYNPNFLAGDFNGDDSQDIAVILKPVNLELMNEDYPPVAHSRSTSQAGLRENLCEWTKMNCCSR